ncbi:MAG: DUF2937 family protein [Pseudomonadota bacterium]
MVLRAFTFAGGIAAAAATSQFPEFSQQYVQRLGGAVDELTQVAADFDNSAQAEGMTRSGALEAMQGNAFVERRRADMERTFARLATMRSDLEVLQTGGPFTRAANAARMRDSDVARATFAAYQPAIPLTFDGLIFTCIGLIGGASLIRLVAAVLNTSARRRTA